jgi:ribose 1,5-bisphosphokinase PhnN
MTGVDLKDTGTRATRSGIVSRFPALAVAVVMIGTVLLASRSASHLAACETRADVEARVAMLSQRMQGLANAHAITLEQLGTAVQAVNAADVQYTPTQSFQQHCVELDVVAAALPSGEP